MKIAISINTAWNIANFRAGLIRALIRAGHEVIAVAPPDENVAALEALGCRFVPLAMDNKGTSPWADAGLFLRFRSNLARERPDVFLGYTIKPNVYGSLAARSLGIPVINNVSGLGTAFIKQGLLTKIVKALYRQAFERSYRVFFQNDDDRQLFLAEGLVREAQTGLLPGSGINLEHFRPEARESDDEDTIRFLLIARLLKDKGIGEYVEAARIVKQAEPTARFQLLGFLDVANRTAVSREEVEGWVAEGIIDYLGSTGDVRPFIREANCVVLPSYREGTPRTLLEAAAMGKPLIATDVPGCREVVDDGVNGLMCKVKDAGDLARRIVEFIELSEEQKNAMGRASRQIAEEKFNEKFVIERYLATLKEIEFLRAKGIS